MEFDDRRPFTTAQWVATGRTRSRLRRRDYRQIMSGVWVLASCLDDDSVLRAALALHPATAFASHLSAATVLGLPVPDSAFAHVTVSRAKDRRFRPPIKSHVTGRRRGLTTVRGIRVTDPVATFIDCAGTLSFVELVILGDALVRKYDVTPRQLVAACRRSTNYYAKLARAAADYVRDGVDSPMETRLRMLIVLAGLPEPVVNHVIYDEAGRLLRRFDLSYPRIKLIVEYDGRQHANSTRQWITDLERREEFDDAGYRIIVVTSEGIFSSPDRTLERVRRQLVLRGWGDVPPISEQWREHFAA